MIAYEMLAKQHFYMMDLRKASYYLDRAMRGKFEVATSKVRELSLIQYHRKIEEREDKQAAIDSKATGVSFEQEPQYEQIKERMEKALQTISKIQKRSREGYYKLSLNDKKPASEKLNKEEVQKEMERIKKLTNLYEGHDLKFDRLTKVRRAGTPVEKIQSTELPSPVATKNSKNSALLPFTKARDSDAPVEEEKQFKKKNFGFQNYLQQFHEVSFALNPVSLAT